MKLVHTGLFGGKGKVTVEVVLERQPPAFECALRCTLAPGASVTLIWVPVTVWNDERPVPPKE